MVFSGQVANLLHPVSLGTILGLVLGKPLGIVVAAFVVVRLGFADLPEGVTWRRLLGAACVCGIGFSESVFFADAAFTGTEWLPLSKLSVIVASTLAAALGWIVLRWADREAESSLTAL